MFTCADLKYLFLTFMSHIFFFLDCGEKFVRTKLWFSIELNKSKFNLLQQNFLLLYHFIKWGNKKCFLLFLIDFMMVNLLSLKGLDYEYHYQLCYQYHDS